MRTMQCFIKICGINIGNEFHRRPVSEPTQCTRDHRWSKITTADTNVDHIADLFSGVAEPLAGADAVGIDGIHPHAAAPLLEGVLAHQRQQGRLADAVGAEIRPWVERLLADVEQQLAAETHGHYMDQFTYAERATDWRGNNNIAESMFEQMAHERHPVPAWIVVGAGTGGTSATIGRYIRYRRDALATTRLAVVDPERSVFFDAFVQGRRDLASSERGRIEGIGRPRVEPSFLPPVIDRMLRVPDAMSFAAALDLSQRLGRRVGPSTGTNFAGALHLARGMAARGETGSIATLICDAGERYDDTLFAPGWLAAQGLDGTADIQDSHSA